ncbi:MAG: DUF427 domain-containing protein [Ignavibacteriaceae bacterium]|nr:DUF427 domain-containing protein [Ignavibacteriaceae bacterium]
MVKAIWDKTVLAESNDFKIVDGHYYFPINSVKKQYLRKSSTKQADVKNGTADFYNIVEGQNVCWNAAWSYPEPRDTATGIKDHIGFSASIKIKK